MNDLNDLIHVHNRAAVQWHGQVLVAFEDHVTTKPGAYAISRLDKVTMPGQAAATRILTYIKTVTGCNSSADALGFYIQLQQQ